METYNFIIDCGFDYLHVFPYSPRPGTLASKMENQIPESIKKERVTRLIELGKNLKDKYEDTFEGKEVEVIIETYDPKLKMYHGYSSNYLDVYVKSEENIKGKLIKAIYHKMK